MTTLPLVSTPRPVGARAAATCHFRCDDACSKPVPNASSNPTFAEIVAAQAARRTVLKAGGAITALVGLHAAAPAPAAAAPLAAAGLVPPPPTSGRIHGFAGIADQPAANDAVVVPDGFRWKPIISWGDPILAGAPPFDFEAQTPAAQAGQFGYNNDFTALLRHHNDNEALLVCNHEYTNDSLMFRGFTSYAAMTDDQLKVTMAAHGMSVVHVSRKDVRSAWGYRQRSRWNRRITARTPFRMTGPAAGDAMLQTAADPTGLRVLGTLNNCAGGVTPWGTVLSGEENVNQYFAVTSTPADQATAYARYGLSGTGRGWERVDPRFDTTVAPNEPNRFGWIVEVDPSDPTSTPRKHTAMGRFKHEGANVTIADSGRVVAYMGDDERYDYLYKFVSHRQFRPGPTQRAKRHNMRLLESGDLYVARFTGDGLGDGEWDGTGEWLPLVVDNTSLVPGMSVAQVLIHTRLAADLLAPTKMDRPEDVEVNPVNKRTYVALTNNTRRLPTEIDEANPRAANKHGHVLELTPVGDHSTATFTWRLVLIAGDPADPQTYFLGYDRSEVSSISCPDNVAFDAQGNLWIATDGNQLGNADGLYMMPLQGAEVGRLRQFLSMPVGAECCGPVITFDERGVLVAVQHPGEIDGATPDAVASTFPYRGNTQPRPSVIHAYRR